MAALTLGSCSSGRDAHEVFSVPLPKRQLEAEGGAEDGRTEGEGEAAAGVGEGAGTGPLGDEPEPEQAASRTSVSADAVRLEVTLIERPA
jgi:hypothetical protein